jgi:hypothetical protein
MSLAITDSLLMLRGYDTRRPFDTVAAQAPGVIIIVNEPISGSENNG